MPKEATSFHEQESADIARRAKAACEDLRRAASTSHRPLPPDPLCEELHIAVERAAARSAASINSLRFSVRRFTAALKQDGASPEAILITLKSVINSRTFSVAYDSTQNWSSEDLRQQISTWCIEEFFTEKKA